MLGKFICRLVLKMIGIILVSSALIYSKDLVYYRGTAYDFDTKQILYTDEYQEFYNYKNELFADVIYRDLVGNVIASKNVVYNGSYATPSFTFLNLFYGSVEGTVVSGNVVTMFSKASETSPMKTKTLPLPENAVIDAGFHYFVLFHWDQLIQETRVFLTYFIPSSLQTFDLEFKKMERSVWHDKDTVLFYIEPRNIFLKLFTDPIILRYDYETKEMISFEGISNIKFPSGSKRIYLEVDSYL